MQPSGSDLAQLAELVEQGKLRVIVDIASGGCLKEFHLAHSLNKRPFGVLIENLPVENYRRNSPCACLPKRSRRERLACGFSMRSLVCPAPSAKDRSIDEIPPCTNI